MICLLFALALSGCSSGNARPAPRSFSVDRFGAKGDGIADDGPAIQRALTAAAASGGGPVTFPCGEFALKTPAGLAPGGRSLLYLKGVARVQLSGQGHCTHLFTLLPQKSVIEFEDSSYVSVSGLRITTPNLRYIETFGMDGGSAVRYTGVSHGKISGVEVDGATAGALYLTKGTSSTSVVKNFIHDTWGAGLWEDNCGSASTTSCAPASPPKNNVFDSNTLTDTSQAMLAAIATDDGGASSHAIIRNNTVSWTHAPLPGNPEVHCIQIGNTADVDVLNNRCTGTPWDAIAVTTGAKQMSQRIKIKGNILVSSGTAAIGGSGVVIYDDPTGAGIRDVTISFNTISVAADDGIRLFSASRPGGIDRAEVSHNTVSMVDQLRPGTRFGIDVEFSAHVRISSNTISCRKSCIAAGVNVNASTATTPASSSNQVKDIAGVPLAIR